jgi:hypothetical protein
MAPAGQPPDPHLRDGHRRPNELRSGPADGVDFMLSAPNCHRKGVRDLLKKIGDSGRKRGQISLFVSIMPHFGLHYLGLPDESLGGWSRVRCGVNWGPDGFRRSDS